VSVLVRPRSASLIKNMARWISQGGPAIQILEVRDSGEQKTMEMTTQGFLSRLPKQLPLRDLRMLLRVSRSPTTTASRKPTLLPRPASECYILDIEHIRLLCYSDRCLILDPGRVALQAFLTQLSHDIEVHGESEAKTTGNGIIKSFYQNVIPPSTDFEHIVLEAALSNIVNKFNRHLEIIKPPLDGLLLEIAQDPATYNLRRLLAFRKSLSEFEASVTNVMKEVEQLLKNDEDLAQLYLTSPEREMTDHVEIELLLEAYYADFEEIVAEIKTVKDTIEDTNQFISAHLDSVRNKMLRMSLVMELGALALGSGAVVGGIFGMNLATGLEEHPHAFLVTLGGMGLVMTGIFAGFSMNYRKLKVDTSSAHSFKALKNFFTYVDDLEHIVKKKRLNENEFKEALNQLTGLKVSNEESRFIFRMLDANRDGVINTEDELNIKRKVD